MKIDNIQIKSINRTIGISGHDDQIGAGFLAGDKLGYVRANLRHTHFLCLYLISGRGRYVDHFGVQHTLLPGCLTLRPPNEVHSMYRDTDPPWLEFYLRLPNALYVALRDLGAIDPRRTCIHPGLSPPALERAAAVYEQLNLGSPIALLEALSLMTGLLADWHRLDAAPHGSTLSAPIQEACGHLESDLSTRLNMPDVAKWVGMGYEHFRKQFREELALSPKEYRIRRRLEEAQKLLLLPGTTLTSVADSLGYPDVPTFARQFKRVVGTSPGRFQRQY